MHQTFSVSEVPALAYKTVVGDFLDRKPGENELEHEWLIDRMGY